MTISAIKDAMESYRNLYIDSNIVEIIFLEELTETIQVKYLETGIVSFVTKSSITEIKSKDDIVKLDDTFIIRIMEC